MNKERINFFLEQDQTKDIQMTFWPLRVTREAYNFSMLYQSLIKNKGIDPQRGSKNGCKRNSPGQHLRKWWV